MTRRRFVLLAASLLALSLTAELPGGIGVRVVAERLPQRLTDRDFWTLVSDYSEADGTFHSDNLLSNEVRFQRVIPELVETARAGRVYLGVGPEQNFTYMVALKPAMAFIVDIRRGNLDLHLMYKALFEMSANRAEFISRLFSRERPNGLGTTSSAVEIFSAFADAKPSQGLYDQNLKAIRDHLVRTHGFSLSRGDLEGIEFVYRQFFTEGLDIHYELRGGFNRGGGFPTYADLMVATDADGKARGYLASETNFLYLKDLESRNMVVPVVGNFAGPKALRAVAAYLRQREATVSAFYVSNVEQYLRQDGLWADFCRNVSVLPLDATSTFIRSSRGGFSTSPAFGPGFSSQLIPMSSEVRAGCGAAAR